MESKPVASTDQEWTALSLGNTSTWTFDLADWDRGDIAVGMVFDPRPEEGQILSTVVLRARAFSTRGAVTRLEFDKTVENPRISWGSNSLGFVERAERLSVQIAVLNVDPRVQRMRVFCSGTHDK